LDERKYLRWQRSAGDLAFPDQPEVYQF